MRSSLRAAAQLLQSRTQVPGRSWLALSVMFGSSFAALPLVVTSPPTTACTRLLRKYSRGLKTRV
jgi:hypothetical protein